VRADFTPVKRLYLLLGVLTTEYPHEGRVMLG